VRVILFPSQAVLSALGTLFWHMERERLNAI